MSSSLIRAGLALLFAALTAATQAQTFPSKPIRLICPFPPGGAVDIASRAIAAEMSKTLGQPVTVENRPGAGGNIGGAEVARAAPDGYTMLMTTSGIQAINPVLYPKMQYDPNKDLTPIAALVSLSNVLVVNPAVKASSVGDLVALARAQPGKMTFASSGSGTSIHMSAELFKQLTKIDIVHVPYKGSAPALTDLIGGQVNLMFDNIPSALPHIKAGRLNALATTGARRDPTLPDLPTVAEAGVKGYESGVWFGLAAPAGTPKEVVARLADEAVKATKSPDYVKRMTEVGYVIVGVGPDQMAEMIRAEINRWGPVVKSSGATAD
jgi:tripartite-type tricarboxylate transporter receptor subunit TctC